MNVPDERLKALKLAGYRLANACYNISYPGYTLSAKDRDLLRELVREWDAAERSIGTSNSREAAQ